MDMQPKISTSYVMPRVNMDQKSLRNICINETKQYFFTCQKHTFTTIVIPVLRLNCNNLLFAGDKLFDHIFCYDRDVLYISL